MLGTLVSVIMMASGCTSSISARSKRTKSWASGRLIQVVPDRFHVKATASNRNTLTPWSRYIRIIRVNSSNTSGFEKSKSIWSWLKVHHTFAVPLVVSTACSKSLVRGRTTCETSKASVAVKKNPAPGATSRLKFSNHTDRLEQWLSTRSAISLKSLPIARTSSQSPRA